MNTITITDIPGFEQWREAARHYILAGVPPCDIGWKSQCTMQRDLFAAPETPPAPAENARPLNVSKAMIDILRTAMCHSDPNRFALCYTILWRYARGEKNLLMKKTDEDVMRLTALAKAVYRDGYKMTAFLRFRDVNHNGEEHFIAWHEPEHYTLELKLDFFKTRFRNMRWSILTPYRAAHWDMQTMTLEDNPDPSVYPQDDKIEGYWLTYYANIFNPARPKRSAMLTQMPKKYWKNMPETALIDELLQTSDARARDMIDRTRGDEEKPEQ